MLLLNNVQNYDGINNMDFLIVVAVFIIISVLLPWFNINRISKLEKRLDVLDRYTSYAKMDIQNCQTLNYSEQNDDKLEDKEIKFDLPVQTNEFSENVYVENDVEENQSEKYHSLNNVYSKSQDENATSQKNGFEFDLMSKLPVWIGSVSIIFAIFYLVKYSIEYGLLGPMTRVSLGTFAGVAMIGASLWIHKKEELANSKRIAQGIAGAGIAALYVCVYASVNLYEFLEVATGFGLMGGITIAAVSLALTVGQPIAVLGLFGGLLTPALINTGEANVSALFGYLFLLYGSIIFITARREWWKLSLVALAGVYCWAFVWLVGDFNEADSLLYILFSMGIVIITLFANEVISRKRDKVKGLHFVNISAMAAGITSIIMLSTYMTLGLSDWALLATISLAFMALYIRHQGAYLNSLIANIIVMHIFYFFWINDAALSDIINLTGLFIGFYIVAPQIIMTRTANKVIWPIIQMISGVSLFAITYIELCHYRNIDSIAWSGIALIGAFFYGCQMLLMHKSNAVDSSMKVTLNDMYLWIINGFVIVSAALVIPSEYWAVTLALYITGLALVHHKLKANKLKDIITFLGLIFIALNYEQILLFLLVILNSFIGETNNRLGEFVLSNPLLHLGVPAILAYITFLLLTVEKKTPQGLSYAVFGIANILLLMTGYYLFRQLFHDGSGHIFMSEIGFIERGIITIMLAVAGIGTIEYTRRKGLSYLKPWGVGLFRMAIIRFIAFDVFLHNPYVESDQYVGSLFLINGITLTYGGMLVALALMLKQRNYIVMPPAMHKFYSGLTLVTLFTFISLTVRHIYHGANLTGEIMGVAELYTYSVMWLLTGLVLLAAGIKLDNLEFRKASLAFIALAVGKVFLVDAAELEGLYRVASFTGLGVSLIGLSYFYTKFISDKSKDQAHSDA